MCVGELLGLNEHPARAAAGIVDPAFEGFDHLDQQSHNGLGVKNSPPSLPSAAANFPRILVDAT